MPAPTLIATVQIDSPWTQTNNILALASTKAYTGTLSTSAGDLIVVVQGSADEGSGQLTVGDGTNTYTQRTNLQTFNHCAVNIATAPDTAGGTRSLTLTRVTVDLPKIVGGVGLQFRSHGGVGNVLAAVDDVQTGNLTCSANSAVVVICVDWNATTGAASWATINGNAPTATYGIAGDGATWAAALAYWADVGAAGSKTITLSSPNFGVETFAAIEILGTAGGSTQAPRSMHQFQM